MQNDSDNKTNIWRTRAFVTWTIVGLCLLAGVVIYLCGILWQAVATIIVTALAVFLLHGLVDRLEHRGMSRSVAAILVFLAVTLIVLACVLALIPAVVSQLTALVNMLPSYSTQLQDAIVSFQSSLGIEGDGQITALISSASDWLREQGGNVASTLANGVIGGLVGLGNVGMVAFMSFLCTLWILLDLPKISKELRSLFSDERLEDIDIIGNAFGTAVYGWAKSTLVCAIINGILSGIAFFLCGVPYSGLLGFMCGILYFVPYLGPLISAVVVGIIALFVSPLTCIMALVLCVVLHNIVGSGIAPRLMKNSVSVHPAVILIAILVGGALGGATGMLLSIPVVAAIQGVFITYFEARTGKTITSDDGALFQTKAEAKLPLIDQDTGKIKLPKV